MKYGCNNCKKTFNQPVRKPGGSLDRCPHCNSINFGLMQPDDENEDNDGTK